MTSNQRLPIW